MGALVAAAVVAVIVRATLVDFHRIGSESMQPLLAPGDGIMVDRTAYRGGEVRRGDVVVFDGRGSFLPYQRPDAVDALLRALHLSGGGTSYVKRVIAVGGDTLECCDADGMLLLNGEPLEEPYVYDGDAASDIRFVATVPEGRVWVMGDHRAASADSRALLGAPGGGMIAVERILGRVTSVVWPLDRAAALPREGE
ncbi:signal peptidase I [Zafaria cholistanensis]|uniref:Signal peptidase I n=1 Tax=Zafaria cholistanensis TaxID=1682741 RepID=A0A5A7NLY2_9MICC|nr:signal peptidase I [Zafaria cholistanensis]GER21953.1 signal peptidase I [Zafaria cholistanensis]